MSANADVYAPINANGRTYWLSPHAARRALEMGVPLRLMPLIISGGERFDAPPS